LPKYSTCAEATWTSENCAHKELVLMWTAAIGICPNLCLL